MVTIAQSGGNGFLDLGRFNSPLILGPGVFTDATSQLPAGNDRSYDVEIGDVDNDGDLDIVVANGGYWLNRLDLNDGSGNFSPISIGNYSLTNDVELGDVDGDGDKDIVTAEQGRLNRLYLNNGTGNFTDATSQLPANSDSSYDVDLGDVDGDGDKDIVVANYARQNRLYLNAEVFSTGEVIDNGDVSLAYFTATDIFTLTNNSSLAIDISETGATGFFAAAGISTTPTIPTGETRQTIPLGGA